MTKKATTIPKLTEVRKSAAPVTSDAEKALELIESLSVTTHADLETAVVWTAEVKSKFDEIDGKRKSWVDPLRAVIDDINATFKPALDSLKKAEKSIKASISDYVNENAEKRNALLAEAGGKTNGSQLALLEKADQYLPPKIKGMSIREKWTGEIYDADALLDFIIENDRYDLLMPNIKALESLTKAAGRDPGIPGWNAYQSNVVAITPSKVVKP